MERGKIRNDRFAGQLRDFTYLRWNNITPTDIDLAIDFGGKFFVFSDMKHKSLMDNNNNVVLATGQKLFFERLISALRKTGISAIYITCVHNQSPEDKIQCEKARVTEYFYNGEWHYPKKEITLKEAIQEMLNSNGLSKIYLENSFSSEETKQEIAWDQQVIDKYIKQLRLDMDARQKPPFRGELNF